MLGIIGGTGLYQLEALTNVESLPLQTPYGSPSAPLTRGNLGGTPIVFLPRHGQHHQILPGEVNFRANIHALKQAGVTSVIGVSAVGSLTEEMAPGHFVLPDQYLDFTKQHRPHTFFGQGLVAHISTAEPTCRVLAESVQTLLKKHGHPVHSRATYACVEGPRLGNKAESHFLRKNGCHLVGMTNVPEVYLAREAQMSYVTIAIVTDYDCWMEDPTQHVSVEQVFPLYKAGVEKIKAVLGEFARNYIDREDVPARHALQGAVLTPVEALSPEKRELLSLLRL
jgi:5'-methylthioadenosine phosphorylase